ncbi:MAG TPA: EamA family transporter [Anaeromyxobacteraceae bacterium]|nr:EamA family transporter [Anaeromyxobacteraceae bacterium]
MRPPRTKARGYLVAALSAFVLSTTALFIRHLTRHHLFAPLVLAFWRDLLVVLVLAPALALVRWRLPRVERGHLAFLAGYGLVLALFNSLWTSSVALTGAALATVLVYSSVAFSVVLGFWWLKERLSFAKVLATLLCMAGCALVAGAFGRTAPRAELGGVLAGILSGLCYALYSLFGRMAARRGLDAWTTLLYTFGFAALGLCALNLFFGPLLPGGARHPGELFSPQGSLAAFGLLFALAAGPTLLGFGLYNVSLGLLPSSVANLILTLEPVFTAVAAYFVLGERLKGTELIGCALVLIGVIGLRIFEGGSADDPGGARPGSGTADAPAPRELEPTAAVALSRKP